MGSPGSQNHSVRMLGLSTCVWCKKMRELLESNGVVFELVYVDKLDGDARRKAVEELTKWNPDRTFPTVIVDESRAVRGYKPDEVKEALGL